MHPVCTHPQIASSAITRQLGLSIGKPVRTPNPRTALVIPCRTRLTRQPSPHRQPASGTAADDSLPDSQQQPGQQQTRRLPQVEQLLQQPFLAGFIEALSRPLVTQAVRDTLSELRQSEDFRQHGVAPRADRGADCQALPTAVAPASNPGDQRHRHPGAYQSGTFAVKSRAVGRGT